MLNSLTMLGNYLTTGVRAVLRHKTHLALNLLALQQEDLEQSPQLPPPLALPPLVEALEEQLPVLARLLVPLVLVRELQALDLEQVLHLRLP